MTEPGRLPDEEVVQLGVRRRRLRIDIAVGALVLLGVVLFLRGTTGHSAHKPTAAPNSTAVPTPLGGYGTGAPDSGSGLLAGVAESTLPVRVSDDAADCPPGYPCAISGQVPSGVRAAIHAVFPTARIQYCYTVRLTGRPDGLMWFRQINAEVDGAALTVQIQAPAPPGMPAQQDGQFGSTTYYSTELGAYYLTMQFDWPGGTTGVLARLASDRRLLAG